MFKRAKRPIKKKKERKRRSYHGNEGSRDEQKSLHPLIVARIFRVKGHEKLYANDVLQSLDGFTGKGTWKDRKIVPFTTHSRLSRKVLLIHEDGFRLKTVSVPGI